VRYGLALITGDHCWGLQLFNAAGVWESHYFFFSAAVRASALYSGLGPGLPATAVLALVSAYLFIAPFHSFRIEVPEAAQRLAMFVSERAVISSVGHVIRNNRTPELVSTWGRYASPLVLVAGAAVLKRGWRASNY
jgi:hypothetical protein